MKDFVKVIESYYKSRPAKMYQSMTPSASMLGACPRASFAKLIGMPETTPPNVFAMQNFEVGNVTEAVIARALDQQGRLISWWTDSQNYGARYEQEDWCGLLRNDQWEDKELNVTGTPDIIARDDQGESVLVDIKTASTTSSKFTLNKIKKGIFWEESLGYKLQLGTYMLLLKKRFEEGKESFFTKYGKLIIIDKNQGNVIAEPVLEYTEELEATIKNKLFFLNETFKDCLKKENLGKILPPCDCAHGWKKHFGVNYCSYGEISSIAMNSKKRMVPTRCCNAEEIISFIKANNICK